ncbi:MAG: hypothetical protein QOJ62_3031 [Actinomycetota bacterium]|nr:hypothetical protein [Actinomycetota bacterium]
MRRSRFEVWLVGAVAAVTAGSLALSSPLAVAAPAATQPAPDSSAPQPVIVVLRDQLPGTPADSAHLGQRGPAALGSQDAVLSRLAGAAPQHVKHFTLGNAFSATVTPGQATALALDPAVARVVPDRPVPVTPPSTQANPAGSSSQSAPSAQAAPKALAPTASTAPSVVPAAACSTNPAKPLLEPEALGTINARSDDPTAKTAAALGIDGTGVRVAYIADGINPNNAGFIRKNGKSAIVDYKDFYGTGPNAPTGGAEAFGDASSIAAQGNVTFDVADFANPNVVTFPGGHCYIRIVGVSPGADIVALKAGSDLLPNSAILQAIDYAVTVAHVDVLNESFGANIYPDSSSRDTIQLFNDQAVAVGVTVTISTGDAGVTSTIGSPSADPMVISTGAFTDSRIYNQTGYALATRFGNGKWLDRNISSLSSAGITQNGRTIDLSAPGEADWALCDDSGNFGNCTTFQGTLAKIQSFGGTSQSAPLTAGVAALVIQAYRKTHGGSSPSPALVKRILTSTTRDLGLPADEQGTGAIDARAAVEAALTYPGGTSVPAGVSSNIVMSTDQLTLTGAPGTTQTGHVTVQNVGKTSLTVLPSTRRFAGLSSQTQTVPISNTSTDTTPYPTNGAPWVFKKVTFNVPSGADRLNATILWQSGAGPGSAGPVVRLSLFAPDGTYAANTRPQGGGAPANYGNVDVRQPAPGTWTAVLYTPANTGFTGNVKLQTDTQRAIPAGSISPSLLTLQPGQSATVSVSLQTPAVGGDAVYAVSLGSSNGHQTAIPVIMRALVPTSSGVGTFAGTILGGNARAYAPAQTFSYAFDVPAGKKDLNVSVTMAKDPGDLLETVLIDPRGETPSVSTNADLSGKLSLSSSNTVASPAPGRWRYVVVVENPVTGKEISQDFTGRVAFNTQRVAVVGDDNALSGGTLSAGKAHNVKIRVKNTAPAPIAVQIDARTTGLQHLQLAPQFAGSTFALPLSVDNLAAVPAYLVPPDTTRVALSASSTVPAQVELNSPGGGLDLFGDLQQAQDGSTISTATVSETLPEHVTQGYWFTYVQEIGPFTDAGAPSGSTTLVADATTNGFDTNVTSSVGDPYLSAVDPTASLGNPVIIQPGASKVIVVTVTPKGAKGAKVDGMLNIVTTPVGVAGLFNTTGDVLAILPYSYRIG